MKGKHRPRTLPEESGRSSTQQLAWIDALRSERCAGAALQHTFFTHGDSREPEQAGVWGAVMGSFFTLLLTLLLSFPIGVAAAIYLEEFARKNRWTDLIEVNINNLAAVPSIVFGLLGLAVFIGFFGLPRSAPLVGALVLTLADAAHHHHRLARGAQRRAAFDPRSRARHGRIEDPDGGAPRAAAGDARHADGHDHRHGARAR